MTEERHLYIIVDAWILADNSVTPREIIATGGAGTEPVVTNIDKYNYLKHICQVKNIKTYHIAYKHKNRGATYLHFACHQINEKIFGHEQFYDYFCKVYM